MADTRTPEQRRRIMQSVGTKDTGPELVVRRVLHALGYRFRLHRRDLPGKPDIVLPGRRKVIMVHGCLWHGHNCPKGRLPKSREDYWGPKIAANRRRDVDKEKALRRLGWDVLTVWQCETKNSESLADLLTGFLGPSTKSDRLSKPLSVRFLTPGGSVATGGRQGTGDRQDGATSRD